jgi:hypothetical protein
MISDGTSDVKKTSLWDLTSSQIFDAFVFLHRDLFNELNLFTILISRGFSHSSGVLYALSQTNP